MGRRVEHTPGPWQWVDNDTDEEGFNPYGNMSLRTKREYPSKLVHHSPLPRFIISYADDWVDWHALQHDLEEVNARANAALVEIAPEMYSMLRRIFDNAWVYEEDYEEIYELLKKVEGDDGQEAEAGT